VDSCRQDNARSNGKLELDGESEDLRMGKSGSAASLEVSCVVATERRLASQGFLFSFMASVFFNK
jgi:hypothetical protein